MDREAQHRRHRFRVPFRWAVALVLFGSAGISAPLVLLRLLHDAGFAFAEQPSGAAVGAAFPSQPAIAVPGEDARALVTLSLSGGTGTLSCAGDLTRQVVDGLATFEGCTVTAAGTYRLHATSSRGDRATSNSFRMTEPTAASGLLRVVTSPPLPAQVQVNGLPMDDWALDWVKRTPGIYTVSFSDLQGFTTPAPQTVTVSADQVTTVYGTFVERANLRVVTSPPVPSTISIDGVPRNDWGLWTDLPAGAYQVCFGAVAGYEPPPCEDTMLVAGRKTVITGRFNANAVAPGPAAGYGLLRVQTIPAVPSQILVNGLPMTDWGLDWVKVAPGTYTVSFGSVPDHTSPPPQVVRVTPGQPTTVNGVFTQRAWLRVATNPPAPGTITVDGVARADWGLWTSMAPGPHTVCFSALAGFAGTPPCETRSLVAGQLTTVTGTYVP